MTNCYYYTAQVVVKSVVDDRPSLISVVHMQFNLHADWIEPGRSNESVLQPTQNIKDEVSDSSQSSA